MTRNLIITLIILAIIGIGFNFAFVQPGPGFGFGMMGIVQNRLLESVMQMVK